MPAVVHTRAKGSLPVSMAGSQPSGEPPSEAGSGSVRGGGRSAAGVSPAAEQRPGAPRPEAGCRRTTRRATLARRAAALAVVCGLFFGPFAFGGTQVWSLCVLQFLALAAAALWLVFGSPERRGLGLLLAVAALGVLQVVPVPRAVLGFVSPVTDVVYAAVEADGVAPAAAAGSVHPGATRNALRQGLLMLLLVLVARDIAQERRLRHFVAWGAVAAGCLVLLLSQMPWRPRQGPLWRFHDTHWPTGASTSALSPVMHTAAFGSMAQVHVGGVVYEAPDWLVGDTCGPYVVSNHFAGCMGLAMPLAVALLWGVAWRLRSGHVARVALPCVLSGWALVAVSAQANSRAGAAALVAGLLCVVWRLASPGPRRALAGALLALFLASWLGVFLVLAGPGSFCSPSRRWLPLGVATALGRLEAAAEWRLEAWRVAVRMFRSAPLFGSGLGTFADLYPGFGANPPALGFAHNDYLQWAAEAGLAGCAMALGAVAWEVARRRGGDRRSPHPEPPQAAGAAPGTAGAAAETDVWDRQRLTDREMAAGLAGSLLACAMHALFDWNTHVPANAWALAVVLGLWLAVSADSSSAPGDAPASSGRAGGGRFAACAVLLLLCLAGVGAARQLTADVLMQPLRDALAAQRDWRAHEETRQALLQRALPAALRASAWEPGNADHAELVGRAWLHRSRGRAVPELALAEHWFRRALALCPVRRRLTSTLRQIAVVGVPPDPSDASAP